MALEIIKNIAEAEQKGDNLKNSALQQAEQIKLDADNKGKDILAKARQETKLKTVQLVQDAIKSAQEEVDIVLLKADEDCSKISKTALQKMSFAVNAVIGKVVEIDGNS